MFFIFMSIIALIPLVIGVTILYLLKKTSLARALFLFLFFASLWQIDVAILYGHPHLSYATTEFLFRFFRLGPIMLTPIFLYVAYIMSVELVPKFQQSKWRFVVNKITVIMSFIFAVAVYIINWTSQGVSQLVMIRYENVTPFLFPEYGSLSWVFQINVVLFILSILICFGLNRLVEDKNVRAFLFYFLLTIIVGYSIVILNMLPEMRLFPSGIGVMVFAVSILILVTKLHTQLVEEMNKELEQQKHFLRTVIDMNPSYIYSKDEEGHYTLVNKAFANLVNRSSESIIGEKIEVISPSPEMTNVMDLTDKLVFQKGKMLQLEENFIDSSGNEKWLQTVKVPIDISGNKLVLGVSTDITERKKHENEVLFQAEHDDLTGLPNRRLFNSILPTIIHQAEKAHSKVAVMFLDLDRFKYINDSLGHDVGDLLLVEVANRLKEAIKGKAGISVYRIGGDEFTFIVSTNSLPEIQELAEYLVSEFKAPFKVENSTMYITPSIGISMYPDDGHDARTLIKYADTAMYYLKEAGQNGYQFFTGEMKDVFYQKMLIEKELRPALDRQEFELHYQPKQHISKKEIHGVEALVRWKNDKLGTVSPADFIPIAEETGLILPLGEWILHTACLQNKKWQTEGYSPLQVCVNISMRQIAEKDFVDKVLHILEITELEPQYLDLEITESIAMADQQSVIDKLAALRNIGITIAMDDFGTGYSSLSYINKYPLDAVKIDQSFIRNIHQSDENKGIVKSILAIAQQLKLKVIAEGIECKEELEFLNKEKCHYAQGYYISRPLPANEVEKLF
ncbi:sensor domain-containing protein [Sutcliffiella deserti]|uniref:sensor domain-containing protein n=1 Tax=Sutcliffiella deserti TaxID=2875501 RepID=UPI001CBF4C8B|nr:EAL domain-containing protein [Sutcliffiella deserti]